MKKVRSPEEKEALLMHVRALRKSLIISVGAVGIAFLLLFYLLCDPLIDFVLAPVRERGIDVISTAVADALMLQFKACLVAAVVVAFPVIVWQIWDFIAPALYPHEKRVFALLFFVALLLFVAGVAFCYMFVFPLTIDLFWEAASSVQAEALWSVKEYFNFVLGFVLPFGLMFEMPVAVYMLSRRGMVTYTKMAKGRKFWILAIAVIAAVLTPPDVVSQSMLMAPMIILLEISVQISRFVKPKVKEEAAA